MLLDIKHLMTGPEGNSEFCFQRISMFPETKSRETLRFEQSKWVKPVENKKSRYCQMTCNSGQHFVGNSELFPV